ncbi:unnamed protein product [Coccothraustes coccothraustes]
MEAAARRRPREPERQEREQDDGGRVMSRSLSGQSYWLDLWLFILFDLALFLLIYLLP